MPETAEKLWLYDAVTPGQQGPDTQVAITPENIAGYAQAALCSAPRYRTPGPDALAMPTMALSYAPLLREEIAEANGFIALEQSHTARRQTPFAKCEIRWHRPVTAGDVITASRRVLEKYERRGSRFVTFRVQAVNRRNQLAAEYDYTCIFDYAKGQRERPNPNPPSETAPSPPATETEQPRPLLDFNAAQPGTPLTAISITESQDIINRRSAFRLAGRPNESNIHTDEEFARQNIFGGTVNSGPATMSYVDQMLQLSFPAEAFYRGGRLLMRAITPFRSNDTVTFTGEVTAQHPDPDNGAAQGIIECRIRGTNQRNELVCLADATLRLH